VSYSFDSVQSSDGWPTTMSLCETEISSFSALDDAIAKLVTLNNASKQAPCDAAGIFVAAATLMTQLKKDQLTLLMLRCVSYVEFWYITPNLIPHTHNPHFFSFYFSIFMTPTCSLLKGTTRRRCSISPYAYDSGDKCSDP
jgi:hypothetical protein